jgi:hypothetical protein
MNIMNISSMDRFTEAYDRLADQVRAADDQGFGSDLREFLAGANEAAAGPQRNTPESYPRGENRGNA